MIRPWLHCSHGLIWLTDWIVPIIVRDLKFSTPCVVANFRRGRFTTELRNSVSREAWSRDGCAPAHQADAAHLYWDVLRYAVILRLCE